MDGSSRITRTSLQIMMDTVFALMMRELKTRFGAKKLGYFWAVAEPAGQAILMGMIFSLVGRSSLAGVPVILFMVSGIIPFKFFSKLFPQLANSVSANKALFIYRQVSPIDPLVTRLLIEVLTYLVVFSVLLIILSWAGIGVNIHDFLSFFMANVLLVFLGVGIGLLLCVATLYWQDTSKLISVVMAPMFIISGVLFAGSMVPQKFYYLFSWNPIFHTIELIRQGMFYGYQSPIASWEYVGSCALVCNFLGLLLYKHKRHKFISS